MALNNNVNNTISMTNAIIRLFFLTFFISLSSCGSPNQISSSPDAAPEYRIPTANYELVDKVYRSQIKSVQLHPLEAPISPPYIDLYNQAPLRLSFDDLDADFKNYYYTIIHCTADWRESDLFTSDYIDGFQELNVSESESSFNTAVAYTHYEVIFPSPEMRPVLSGNYLFYVFLDADRTKPVLSRRFVVYEQLVRFRSRVKESTVISESRYMQEVDFDILHPEYPIPNPYTELKVSVLQNHRWDNAISDLQPMYVKNNELTYDYDEENNFNGGNEFRNFDLKSLRYSSNEVGPISNNSEGVPQALLLPDEKRTFSTYRTDQDIQGQYLVRNSDAFNDNTESQYVWVYFNLPMETPFYGKSVFIFGELSLFNYSNDFKMNYNSASQRYEALILLKQGYYNYIYMVKDDGRNIGDETVLEGNHAETVNDYSIFAYYYDINNGYDRVVGALFTDTYNR